MSQKIAGVCLSVERVSKAKVVSYFGNSPWEGW